MSYNASSAFLSLVMICGLMGTPVEAKPAAPSSRPSTYPTVRLDPELAEGIRSGDLERISQALAKGSSIADEGDLSLRLAVKEGSDAVVKLLIDRGANVNSRDTYGCTPLLWAVYEDRPAVIKLLLAKGSLAKPLTCRAPLFVAAAEASPEVVNALIDGGASVKDRDDQGGTPLHTAAQRGRAEIARILIAAGAEVNARNTFDRTPLYYANGLSREEVAQVLVAAGGVVSVSGTTQ